MPDAQHQCLQSRECSECHRTETRWAMCENSEIAERFKSYQAPSGFSCATAAYVGVSPLSIDSFSIYD